MMIEVFITGALFGAVPALFVGCALGYEQRKFDTRVETAVKQAQIETLQSFVGTIKTKRELHGE